MEMKTSGPIGVARVSGSIVYSLMTTLPLDKDLRTNLEDKIARLATVNQSQFNLLYKQ